MLRRILFLIGLLELFAPRRSIAAAERLVAQSPDRCAVASWVVPATRLQGLGYVIVAWRGGLTYSEFKNVIGLVGILAVVAPRRIASSATDLLYGDPDACAWKPWVYPVARLVGVGCILVTLDELRTQRGRRSD